MSAQTLSRWLVIAVAAVIASASWAQQQVSLSGHVLPALVLATRISSPISLGNAVNDEVTLTVVLRRSDPDGFAHYLNDVYDQRSSNFRTFLTSTQVSDRFGPAPSDYEAVLGYFQQQGFTLIEGSANRMTLTVRGTRASAERGLGVTLGDYLLDGRSFFANDQDPSLPADIAARVEAVTGLSNFAKPSARPVLDNLPDTPWNRALWYALCANYAVNGGISAATGFQVAFFQILLGEEIIILSLLNSLISIAQASDLSSSGTGQTYAKCVNQYNKKYGYSTIGGGDPPPPAWQAADGTGQTVGIVAFDSFLMSDVSNYVALMGQPSGPVSNVSQVHVNGGAALGANQDEVLLDIADVLTTAPGAQIVVYDAPFAGGGTSFQTMFNAMINGGVNIISNSWAYCEDQTTLADVQSIDTILQAAAASGISVFSGTGDRGSTCLDGSPNTAHVPASSPHITAVGGTSLQLYPGFTYGKETWWNDSATTPPGGQGGFGVSRFFTRPAYQNGVTSSAMRSIPDVSANADPHYGVKICQASNGGCPTGGFYGGTSSSTPMWAGFAALLNQTQGSNLGFFNPLIYPFAGTSAFHTPASMGSDFAHVGLGSPNLARLHQSLTGIATGPASPSVSSVRAYAQTTAALSEGATAALPSYADGTTQTFIVVTLVDANGIPVGGKTITPSAVGSQAVFTPLTNTTGADTGVAYFWVTDTHIETITVTATDTTDGLVLNEKPRIEFFAPPAAAASISANPLTVPNNGVATTTITVTLQDAQAQPSPGKLVRLSQGTGHSLISGPSPAVTNASGQIQFTATNVFPETVTYTAVDVTDGELAVPGSAAVTFSGSADAPCSTPPTAASGYQLSLFSSGYAATATFNFGNVQWGGCPGVSNPTFDTSGSVFTSDFFDGKFYKFGAAGGAVTNANVVANLGQTVRQPVFSNDGKMYVLRAATSNSAFTGDIIQIDPSTGAIVRTLVTGLNCSSDIAVDPLSGDIFFTNACFGGGFESPSLFRVLNTTSTNPLNPPTLTTYVTLPTATNGAVSFSPDGTIYVASNYTVANPPVLKIGGTNTTQPATITPLAGFGTIYWVTVAETLPSGAAKSLVVLSPPANALSLVDLTTVPVTVTPITVGGASSGVVGKDGCLYFGASYAIYKLTTAAGACGFASTNPNPSLTISPSTVSPNPAQGSTQALVAKFNNVVVPVGTPVLFTVEGANSQLKLGTTDATGSASISYVGILAGADKIIATATVGATHYTSNSAAVTWGAGLRSSFMNVSSPSASPACAPAVLTASLTDASVNPLAAIAGASIHFTLGPQSCDAITNASGVASCAVNPPPSGQYTMTATYAGSGLYTPTSASQGFNVAASTGGGPVPTCAYSRKVHGAAGTFDLPLSMTATSATVEPRQGPTHTIVVAFDGAVSSAGTATVTEGTATAGAPAINGNSVVIGLTGITDQQYVTISLGSVTTANAVNAGGSVRVGFLQGDVNQNRVVTVSDLGAVNQSLAQPVNVGNYLKDLNANGAITVADKGVANAALTHSLPPP